MLCANCGGGPSAPDGSSIEEATELAKRKDGAVAIVRLESNEHGPAITIQVRLVVVGVVVAPVPIGVLVP
jgi:hypothetical protein